MADKTTFTEQDYISQRDALDQQIRVAEDYHHRAGYQQVLGETTQDDVDKALVALDALKNRRRSLEAAWQEARRRAAGDAASRSQAGQAACIAEIDRQLVNRLAIIAKIQDAAKLLARLVLEYDAAGATIKDSAKQLYSMASVAPGDKARHLQSLASLQEDLFDGRDVALISGLLAKEGVTFSTVPSANARAEYDRVGGLPSFVANVNAKIRTRAVSLCPHGEKLS
ncbi:hypothetical protein [Sphingobium limneticum]|uniref:Uncharacterized protein n=1 Tax=Sphingobium limneticum TaxID=1007511 RepID=A0A5J5I793_9SPHN|nr:hypothetical protein [Sphingobium limneticum]KAA9019838.1 hypothetical protein F4U96_06275 [Sphingobium limneticum]KAA9032296.1 hypothetical protein F4U95_06275 [Sphingobium limneticum]